ncbi:MAG: serine hydrolase [Pseudomonadota bacterium]
MLNRRTLVSAALAAPLAPAVAFAADAPSGLKAAFDALARIPGTTTSGLIAAEGPKGGWRSGLDPQKPLFVGSAVKTFILAQVLRQVEAGKISENDQWAVDDSVRMSGSQWFEKLTGTTTARCVLEAMISQSDDTATDICLAKVGPESVRALVREAGLASVRIPDSTRRLVSYLAGAPLGEDIGWAGVQKLDTGWTAGPPRAAVNDTQSMMSSADDLVRWYQTSLSGAFFQKPATLVEYKRILTMADALSAVVPDGLASYGKGGSIDWQDFRCFCVAGQMVVGENRASFCFTVNWTSPESGVAPVFNGFKDAVSGALAQAAAALKG